ncbi:MAG: 2-hydroxyacid dehydrogenase [Betaproteobacteria bacterium]|nr:2-hydroxyacid dehydrogenase [Betaproteobacteria bacterium]NBS45569.1 2-hydroxyacid dehydrogenase [Betaproteobacteria bacterium]
MSKPDVLAVAKLHPFFRQALDKFYTVHDRTHQLDPVAFDALAPRIVAVAATGESSVPRALIERLDAARIVSVFGVGYDGVDAAAALERGIPVTHTPGVLNDDVADMAMALVLGIARRVAEGDRYVRDGRWPEGPLTLGRKVSGARMGIVGMGRIGQAIAQRAAAFGMTIAYTARSAKPALPHAFVPDATTLAGQSDFLVAITPGGAGTRHLINAGVLAALGPRGFLINVARGSVVDEAALIEALRAGTIAGAGLDVFANEPQVPEALRQLPNVLLSPHTASATAETRQAMADLAFANLHAGVQGQPLVTPVPEWTAVHGKQPRSA